MYFDAMKTIIVSNLILGHLSSNEVIFTKIANLTFSSSLEVKNREKNGKIWNLFQRRQIILKLKLFKKVSLKLI